MRKLHLNFHREENSRTTDNELSVVIVTGTQYEEDHTNRLIYKLIPLLNAMTADVIADVNARLHHSKYYRSRHICAVMHRGKNSKKNYIVTAHYMTEATARNVIAAVNRIIEWKAKADEPITRDETFRFGTIVEVPRAEPSQTVESDFDEELKNAMILQKTIGSAVENAIGKVDNEHINLVLRMMEVK